MIRGTSEAATGIANCVMTPGTTLTFLEVFTLTGASGSFVWTDNWNGAFSFLTDALVSTTESVRFSDNPLLAFFLSDVDCKTAEAAPGCFLESEKLLAIVLAVC